MVSLANVGTGLMWLTTGHLLVGNFGLGVLEGWLLARWLRAGFDRATKWMIGANFASAVVGVVLLPWVRRELEVRLGGVPVGAVGWYLLALLLAAYVVTVLLEWPFMAMAASGSAVLGRRRVLAFVGVQAVSYVLMTALYSVVSPISLVTSARVVERAEAVTGGARGWVYFVNRSNSKLGRASLDGRAREELSAEVVPPSTGGFWLWSRMAADGHAEIVAEDQRLVEGIEGWAASRPAEAPTDRASANWAVDCRPTNSRPDVFFAHPFAEAGLMYGQMKRQEDGRSLSSNEWRLSLATPVISWRARFPTILPNGAVVVQMGPRILIVDREKHVVDLGPGESPAVILDVQPH